VYGTYYSMGREEIFHTRKSLPPPTYVVWSGLSGLGRIDPQDLGVLRSTVRYLREALERWRQAAQALFDAAVEAARQEGACTASTWNKILCLPVIRWLGKCSPCEELNDVIQNARRFITEGYPDLASDVSRLEVEVQRLGVSGVSGLGATLPAAAASAVARIGPLLGRLATSTTFWGLVVSTALWGLISWWNKAGERKLVSETLRRNLEFAKDALSKGYSPDDVAKMINAANGVVKKYEGRGGGSPFEDIRDIVGWIVIAVFAVIALYIVGAAVSAVRSARS
jgi:predicted transcriptional regulator